MIDKEHDEFRFISRTLDTYGISHPNAHSVARTWWRVVEGRTRHGDGPYSWAKLPEEQFWGKFGWMLRVQAYRLMPARALELAVLSGCMTRETVNGSTVYWMTPEQRQSGWGRRSDD
jgi:hypothetical protein